MHLNVYDDCSHFLRWHKTGKSPRQECVVYTGGKVVQLHAS